MRLLASKPFSLFSIPHSNKSIVKSKRVWGRGYVVLLQWLTRCKERVRLISFSPVKIRLSKLKLMKHKLSFEGVRLCVLLGLGSLFSPFPIPINPFSLPSREATKLLHTLLILNLDSGLFFRSV